MGRAKGGACAGMGAIGSLLAVATDSHAEITNMDFCNKYPYDAFIAIVYEQKDQGWISRGWLQVKTGECQCFDSAVHVPLFYYRAETDSYDVGDGRTATTSRGDKGDRKFYVGQESFNYFDAIQRDDAKSRVVGFNKYFARVR